MLSIFQELKTEADLEMVGNSKPKNVTFMVEGEIKESTLVQTFQVSVMFSQQRVSYFPITPLYRPDS